MLIELRSDYLSAVLIAVAKHDIRYYLKGVFVEVNKEGVVYIVGTDGCRLNVAKQVMPTPPGEEASVIIPRDQVGNALKITPKKRETILLDTEYNILGGIAFTPVEGQFPAWKKVLPSSEVEVTTEGVKDGSGVNFDYLSDACKAVKICSSGVKLKGAWVRRIGESGMWVVQASNCEDFSAYIAPLRADGPPPPLSAQSEV